ncbi:MAG: xanthine dehydrogenase family protein subunit M [Chloroflexi bacterium]|nr:xanthine dehydrogenase family protein subunit M [Chloroflexota bacterium]
MRDFELLQPKNLADALDALAQNNASVHPLAGGTDMLVDIRAQRAQPDVLVALQNVNELRGVTRTNGHLRVGASTTIAEFLKNPLLTEHDALRQAASVFANPLIRNSATIAGNIGSASPAGDMLPPLLAFDAQIELVSKNGTRTMPLNEFFLGPRKTARNANELISNLQLPISNLQTASAFYKLGLRQADAISLVSVAVWLQRDSDMIRDVRIALGAVAPRPMRATRAEEILHGQIFNETNVKEAARVASEECAPIDDLRASANYRRRMVNVYVRRMLEQAWRNF